MICTANVKLTNKESIELLKGRYVNHSMAGSCEQCAKENAAIDMAIAALETMERIDEYFGKNVSYLSDGWGNVIQIKGPLNPVVNDYE